MMIRSSTPPPHLITKAQEDAQKICAEAEHDAETVAEHLRSTAHASAELAMYKTDQYLALRKEILAQKLEICNQIMTECAQQNTAKAMELLMGYLDEIGR